MKFSKSNPSTPALSELDLQMAKSVHNCKWISFAISTFDIIEKMASTVVCKILSIENFLYYFAHGFAVVRSF